MNKLGQIVCVLKDNRVYTIGFIATYAVLVIFLIFAFRAGNQLVHNQFLRTFEKKTLDQLNIFHQSNVLITKRHFEDTEQLVENLSVNEDFIFALNSKDSEKVQNILERQRNSNNMVDALNVIDSKGIMIYGAPFEEAKTVIGNSFSTRPYFKTVMATKEPFWSDVFKSLGGNYILNYSLPILDSQQNVKFILSGSVYLSSLADKYKNFRIPRYLTFVILDSTGNIISDNGFNPENVVNINNNDRVAATLIAGAKSVNDEEINYKGVQSLVFGSKINASNNYGVYLVSYYDKNELVSEENLVSKEENRIFNAVLFAVSLIMLFAIIIILYVDEVYKKCPPTEA